MDDSKIIEIISKTANIDQNKITLQTTINDLDIDSLSAVELALELETSFDIRIEDEELVKLVTVQDVVDIVERKKA